MLTTEYTICYVLKYALVLFIFAAWFSSIKAITALSEFLAFLKLNKITGEHLAHEIIQLLEKLDLPVEHIHGQGYDGASNMFSGHVRAEAGSDQ